MSFDNKKRKLWQLDFVLYLLRQMFMFHRHSSNSCLSAAQNAPLFRSSQEFCPRCLAEEHNSSHRVVGFRTSLQDHRSCLFGDSFIKENNVQLYYMRIFTHPLQFFWCKDKSLRDWWRNYNRWIFIKNPNGLWPPPPSFLECHVAIFFRESLSKSTV